MVLNCGRPDCVRRAPQTTYNNPHWIPTSITGIGSNSGGNTIQPGYGNPKDYNPYQQQQQQQSQQTQSVQPQQQQQQQPQPLHQQTAYSQLYSVQSTGPKYEPIPFQSVNQPQYAYEGVYPTPLNSYPQSVQLVPCLCPVNKDVLEQQTQLQQQSSIPVTPTSSSFPTETNNAAAAAPPPPPQPTQKKTL